MLVHFWWWQFGLYGIRSWTFGIYLFVLIYAVVLFLLCAFLFPESMQDYKSYEDFFYARRGWFFGLLAATYLLDVIDTLIKGEEHFARFGWEYLIRTPLFVVLCLVAMRDRYPAFPHRLRRLHADLPGVLDRAALRHDRLKQRLASAHQFAHDPRTSSE